MDEAKEKFFQCHDDTKTAFEELCAMVDALNVSEEHNFVTYIQILRLSTRFAYDERAEVWCCVISPVAVR